MEEYLALTLPQNASPADEPPAWIFLAFTLIFFLYLFIKFRYAFRVPIEFLPIRKKYKKILEDHFPYYQKLKDKDKIRFEKRVQYFITTKKFIPRNFQKVTAEMKALIAASAVQLTFGFPDLNLVHFKRILIYPDKYYSLINRRYHKGEVNPSARIIVLSWKSFLDGYLHPETATNLGLHEMAHALRLENNIFNREYNFFEADALTKWEKLSKEEVKKIQKGKDTFFRKYAGTNTDEFFSVAVENFFEKSNEFKQSHPELYITLARLLRQDPMELFQIKA
jgi:MtfA peptidase